MATRPYISFAEVKERVPIPDVLKVLGIADRFREQKGALVGVCPLPQHAHGPQPNDSQFRIDCKRGLWLYRCFGDCAVTPFGGGDVVRFVQAMTGLSTSHLRFWFHQHFPDRLSTSKPKSQAEQPPIEEAREGSGPRAPQRACNVDTITVPQVLAPVKPLRFRLNLDPTVPYLRERGLTQETIARYGLGLCSRGLLKGYVAIPVHRYPKESSEENPVAYLGRWPGEDFDADAGKPRYRWPDGFEKSLILYGLEQAIATTREDEPLVVVEGCFAVYNLSQNGRPGSVATFGASLSDEQARLLIQTRRPILLMYDGDQAGWSGVSAAIDKLVYHAFVRSIRLEAGEKADSLRPDRLLWVVNH